MDIEELRNVVKDPDTILPTTLVYLVSATYPMGCSWSSCIAQATTISVVKAAGINEDKIICDTAELPEEHNELAVVATDDIILIHTNAARPGLIATPSAGSTTLPALLLYLAALAEVSKMVVTVVPGGGVEVARGQSFPRAPRPQEGLLPWVCGRPG